MSDTEDMTIKGVKIEDVSEKARSLEVVAGHAQLFRPIDPEPGNIMACPYCKQDNPEKTDHSPLGEYHCSGCDKYFDVRSGIGGIRHLRSFIMLTPEGPYLIIGPQHLEHMFETDSIEIPAAGWFGDASVGMGHGLNLSTIPHVDLDDLGITLKNMKVVLITSSVWHHKQYAKTAGYFLYYHPDAVFSEIRRADLFMATKLGLLLDNSDKQKTAILKAYLEGRFDAVRIAADIANTAVKSWTLGDESSIPEYEDEEEKWYFNWKLWASFFFFIFVLALATKVWGLW